jgi:tight adherence protein C
MNPMTIYFGILVLIILGGITLYETIFGGKSDVSQRLSTEPDIISRFKFGAVHAGRLLQWNIRRLRETQSEKTGQQKLPETLTFAGFRGIESVAFFQLLRVAIVGGTGFAGVLLCLWGGGPPLIGAAAGSLLGYIIPSIVISRIARARQRRMTLELPDVLSLMVVSLEAGIAVSEVLRLVGRETKRQGRLLGSELSVTSAQMAAGMSFEQTLNDLGARTGVDEIKSLAALLIQSEKIGARLAPALRASADLLNARRRLNAEEAARKTSVKMLFPLVFFILPAMLLVILGPAVIQLMLVFSKH